MSHNQFYLISSKKSKEEVNGLKKIIFGCVNRANSYGFIWIDDKNDIQHIQFIFGEIVLEWLPKKGLRYSITNRAIETPEGTGFQKGVPDQPGLQLRAHRFRVRHAHAQGEAPGHRDRRQHLPPARQGEGFLPLHFQDQIVRCRRGDHR